MDYRLLIARRYLVGRRQLTLISIITGVSVAGVAVGVAALVVVLSVMNGFFDVVRDLLVSYDPHVRIEATGGVGLTRPDTLAALARMEAGVVSATPFVEGQALLAADGAANQVVTVRGVAPGALDAQVSGAMRDGTFDLARRGSDAGIVVGQTLATRMGAFAASPPDAPAQVGGTRVTLLSGVALEQALALYPFGLPDQRAFTVRGTFSLEPAYDETHVFVALADAQQLFRMNGTVSGVDVRLDDLDRAPAVAEALRRRLDAAAPGRFTVRTWADLQGSLYGVMRAEKWAASAILLLIVVVAAFTIVGALTMIVIEKQRDLGALQAMGASRKDVRQIFLLEGLLVGGVGTGIGLALGLGLALAQKTFGFAKLADSGQFIIDAYPVSIRLFDVSIIALVAVALCAVAALYPASRAARVDPARAVQGA